VAKVVKRRRELHWTLSAQRRRCETAFLSRLACYDKQSFAKMSSGQTYVKIEITSVLAQAAGEECLHISTQGGAGSTAQAKALGLDSAANYCWYHTVRLIRTLPDEISANLLVLLVLLVLLPLLPPPSSSFVCRKNVADRELRCCAVNARTHAHMHTDGQCPERAAELSGYTSCCNAQR